MIAKIYIIGYKWFCDKCKVGSIEMFNTKIEVLKVAKNHNQRKHRSNKPITLLEWIS